MANQKIELEIAAKLDNIDRSFAQVGKMAQDAARKVDAAFSGLNLSGIFAGLGAGALTTMVKGVADVGDQLAKMSTRTGIAVEELSKLQYSASLSDVSNEDLASSLGRLNKVLGEAADGSKEATAALARFGIAPGTLNASEAFSVIADRVQNTSDQTKIASAMNDVFGKSWATLVPLIKGGSDGLKQAGDELERMGGVMSGELAAASEAFNDNITRLLTQIDALKLQAIGPLIPLFEELTKAMTETSGQANSLAEVTGSGLKTAFEAITVFGANVAYVLKQTGNEIGGMAAQLNALAHGDFKGFSAIGAMMKADAEQARAEVDALSERLLSTSKKVQEVTGFSGRSRITNFGEGITATPPAATKPKAKKDDYLDPATASAQALVDAINAIDKAQQSAVKSTLNLSAAEEALYNLQSSAFWADMPESWRQMAEQRAAAAIETERMTAEQKKLNDEAERLNDIIASLPSSKIEEAWKKSALLDKALSDGKINAGQYSEAMAQIFGDETQDKIEKTKSMAEELGLTFSSAFEDAIVGGKKFSEVLQGLSEDIARILIRKNVTEPLANSVSSFNWGSLFSSMFSANALGGVYDSPSLSAYSGRVYDTPQFFKFASGAGVFAEAGPEAIMPLSRTSDGKLGVRAQGMGDVSIIINNTVSDQAEVTAQPRMNNGKLEIEVLVQKVLQQDMGRNGPITQGLAQTFGIARAV